MKKATPKPCHHFLFQRTDEQSIFKVYQGEHAEQNMILQFVNYFKDNINLTENN